MLMQTMKSSPNGVTRVTCELKEKAGDIGDYNGHWAVCIGKSLYSEQEWEGPVKVLEQY